MDSDARVWIAARIRPGQTAAFCRQGSDHPSAKAFPINQSGRQLQMYDPKTKEVVTIDTCFGTHHLNLDNKGILWFTGGGPVEGWFNTRLYLDTKDEQVAQGWTVFVMDTNGNGKRDAYVEPDQPVDPKKDKRVVTSFYGVEPSPDGSVWGAVIGDARFARSPDAGIGSGEHSAGGGLRGAVEQSEGVGAGIRAARHGRRQQRRRLDRAVERPLRQLRSPQVQGTAERADGHGPALSGGLDALSRCPVRTTKARPNPAAPKARTTTSLIASTCWASARTFRSPRATSRKSLLAIVDGKFLTFRVPYPMGFYAKGMDGRIDDAKAGWKGKGIWTTFATRAPFHIEGGKGTTSKLVKFQVRPDPLAK